jgi:hypothetical protein
VIDMNDGSRLELRATQAWAFVEGSWATEQEGEGA